MRTPTAAMPVPLRPAVSAAVRPKANEGDAVSIRAGAAR